MQKGDPRYLRKARDPGFRLVLVSADGIYDIGGHSGLLGQVQGDGATEVRCVLGYGAIERVLNHTLVHFPDSALHGLKKAAPSDDGRNPVKGLGFAGKGGFHCIYPVF